MTTLVTLHKTQIHAKVSVIVTITTDCKNSWLDCVMTCIHLETNYSHFHHPQEIWSSGGAKGIHFSLKHSFSTMDTHGTPAEILMFLCFMIE